MSKCPRLEAESCCVGHPPGAFYLPLQVNRLLSVGGNVDFKHVHQVIQLFGLSIALLIPTMTCVWLSWG